MRKYSRNLTIKFLKRLGLVFVFILLGLISIILGQKAYLNKSELKEPWEVYYDESKSNYNELRNYIEESERTNVHTE